MLSATGPLSEATDDPSKLARILPLKGWLPVILNCARRTTTALSWGFREHGGLLDASPHLFASGGGQFNSAWRPQ